MPDAVLSPHFPAAHPPGAAPITPAAPIGAWELLKFLISKDYGRAMAKAQFLPPARATLLDDWVGFVRAGLPERTKDMAIAACADGHIKGYSVTGEVAASMAEATGIANAAWDSLLTLGQGSVESIKTAAQQIDEAQRTTSRG